ncbi:hypothetical protein ACFC0M_20850 [Streptomyces sp. NPDC056149]|uniref:hypothetical protein n=1 Tax=Streptomyces sp. NPDC056149 TaxID=3345728 RepID=UPI0035E0243C
MRQHRAWIIELVLRGLLPARGRNRSADVPPTAERPDTPTLTLPHLPTAQGPLRGEDVAFLRPYVLIPEERQGRWLPRARRRASWLSSYGVEAGPRWNHGVEVGC